jgi:hypothetical protein
MGIVRAADWDRERYFSTPKRRMEMIVRPCRVGFTTHAEMLPAALGWMNLLEPRIAPEFEECCVTSAASRRPNSDQPEWSG